MAVGGRHTAKAGATFKGVRLHVHGLTTLGTVAAQELAEFEGEEMVLHDLTSLDAETAKALAAYSGSLQIPDHVVEEFITKFPINKDMALAYVALLRGSLWTLTTLDAETAQALVFVERWNGILPALTALDSPDSVAIANALATRKGPLKLPNLKRISPKTLTALIRKEDVEIPLIETLELIQEPDGSATEDFIMPEGFTQRS